MLVPSLRLGVICIANDMTEKLEANSYGYRAEMNEQRLNIYY